MPVSFSRHDKALQKALNERIRLELELQVRMLRHQMVTPQLTGSNAMMGANRSPIVNEPQIKKADMGPWEKVVYYWWFYKARRHWKRNYRKQQKDLKHQERNQRRSDIKAKGWNDFYKWRTLAKPQVQTPQRGVTYGGAPTPNVTVAGSSGINQNFQNPDAAWGQQNKKTP